MEKNNCFKNKEVIPDTHFFVYKNQKYPIKFDFFKYASKYFSDHQEEIKSCTDLKLLDEETEKNSSITAETINDFINFIQSKKIFLSSTNAVSLNYLSVKYEVTSLQEITNHYILEHEKEVILDILRVHQDEPSFDTSNYESMISLDLNRYIKDDRLLSLHIPIIYRILKMHAKNCFEANEEDHQQIIIFLFRCLDKFGGAASVLFDGFEFGSLKKEILSHLINEYSDKFDFRFIATDVVERLKESEKEKQQHQIEYEQSISNKNADIQRLKKENRKVTKLKEKLEQENKQLQSELEEQKQATLEMKEEYEEKISAIKSELNKIESEKESVQKQNDKIRQDLKRVQSELEEQKQTTLKIKEEYEESIQNKNSQINKIESEKESVQKQNDKIKQDLKRVQSELEEQKQTTLKIKEEYEESIQNKNSQINKIESEKESVQKQNDKIKKDLKRVQSELEEQKQATLEMKEEYEEKISAINSQLKKIEFEKESVQKQNDKIKQDLKKVQSELEGQKQTTLKIKGKYEEKISAINSQLKKIESEKESVQKQNDKIRQELKRVQSELEEQKQTTLKMKEEYEKSIQNKESQISKINSENEFLKIQNDRFRHESDLLRSEIKIKEMQHSKELLKQQKTLMTLSLSDNECRIIKNKNVYSPIPLLYDTKNQFDGIISYLTKQTGGNIHDNGTITITANSFPTSETKNLLNFNDESAFISRDDDETIICFDFKTQKVKITNYSIKSSSNCQNQGHLKSWIIEISNNGQKWTKIDERSNCQALNGENFAETFNACSNDFARFVRLRQTDQPWGGNLFYLKIHSIEFYGYLETE